MDKLCLLLVGCTKNVKTIVPNPQPIEACVLDCASQYSNMINTLQDDAIKIEVLNACRKIFEGKKCCARLEWANILNSPINDSVILNSSTLSERCEMLTLDINDVRNAQYTIVK